MKKDYNTLMFSLLVIIHFFIFSSLTYAQDNQLINNALVLDIGTANYYDLVIWSDKLGLSSKGSIDELRTGLYSYYEIPSEIKNDQKKNGRSIIIESAKELNYLNDAEIDQDYIILKGDVLLEMIDSETKTSHRIKADKIVFNQSEKTISAFGNINYEISRDGDIEYFYGDSLVFEIETWNGIFFEGVSEKNRLIENKDLGTSENVPFYFAGENIYRGSGDSIELNNGRISSSMGKDPYYHLNARKIWVLGPGEWAIKDAALFVGRIPVFYFPFFFIPGDELVFNPSIGYKNIEGYFINTTTYLLGSKSDSNSDTFSFLKSDNDSTVQKEKIRKGLFLQSTDKDLDISQWPYSNGSYLKLLIDYYSRKGFFIGLDGELRFDGVVKHLNIFTALSLSRYLYRDLDLNSSGNLYTALRLDESGNYVSDFQKSYLFGQMLPFRFAFDIDFDVETDWARLNIILPMYSDSKFRSDFLNRQEALKWTELLNNSEAVPTVAEPDIPSLLWKVNGAITPSVPSLAPFVENLTIDKLNFSLNWQSAVLTQSYSTLLSSNNYIPEDLLSFYYPSTFLFPDISGKISGSIFDTSVKNSTVTQKESGKSEYENLKEPWLTHPDVNAEVNSDSLIISPEFEKNFPLELNYSNKTFSNSLKYSLIPAFSINSIFSTDLPTEPVNISFVSDYSIFTATTSSTLDYSLSVSDSILNFTNSSIFSMYYKEHFDPSETGSVWNSYIDQDRNATKFELKDNLKLSSKPFFDSSVLSESIFSYNLNTTLYNGYYESSDSFKNKYFVWNNESISNHETSIELKYFDSINYQSLKLNAVLPPGNIELYPELTLYLWALTGSLKTGFVYLDLDSEKYWKYLPYETYLKFSFFEKDYFKETAYIDTQDSSNSYSSTELFIDEFDSNIKFNQTLDVNLDNLNLKKASTDIQLWFLTFNYLMEDIVGYTFISDWIADPVSKFQPSKASAGINYNYEPDPLWKNRIRLNLNINSAWTMNLQRYTDTAFTIDLNFSLQIAEFLDLNFESKSVNRASYRYLPGYSDQFGLSELNVFTDLFKSFNFFNKNDRLESNFNIEYLNISAVHHLSDWDLSVKYSGQPVLITNTDNSKEYRMQSEFSVFVTWKPVPEIKKNINYSDKTISFE